MNTNAPEPAIAAALPGAHASHDVDVPATPFVLAPGSHRSQLSAPTTVAKLPGTHGSQTCRPPSGPKRPAAH